MYWICLQTQSARRCSWVVCRRTGTAPARRVTRPAASAFEQPSPAPSCWSWSESSLPTCTCHVCVASRSPPTCGSPRNRSRSGSRTAGSSTRRRWVMAAPKRVAVVVCVLALLGEDSSNLAKSSNSRRVSSRKPRSQTTSQAPDADLCLTSA